jgi:omega-6 fatty acid desaturase (delta-12 desaturase)
MMSSGQSGEAPCSAEVLACVAPYTKADPRASLGQVANSFGLFALGWWLMVRSLAWSYALTLLLALPTAGMLARIFIIQHDCGHGSFFRSKRWNTALGLVCSVLTFTPFHRWRQNHAVHHAHVGNLDRRGVGDVPTLTVREYLGRSRWQRFWYRAVRHPLVMFLAAPLYLLLIAHRLPERGQLRSVMGTNLALAILWGLLAFAIGPRALLLVELPVLMGFASLAVWMFFVQHQFEDTYWANTDDWDYVTAALRGSSYYKLPALLMWFTGNIGLHHIHHLSPRVPNYRLQACHDASPLFRQVPVMTLRTSLRTVRLALWDEDRRRLISFAALETTALERAA